MRFPIRFPVRLLGIALLVFVLVLAAMPGFAQDREVPYWASLRASEINMRVGPSEEYRIEWVYRRPQLPVKVLRIKEGWRLIRDPDGAQGWVAARLLSPERTALVVGEGVAAMRDAGEDGAKLLWKVEPGVVGKLGNCDDGWCAIDIDGRKGFISQERLWGPGEP